MKKILFLMIAFALIFSACKRDANKLEQLGPRYITTEEAFAISSSPANFINDTVHFTARLTKETFWQIEIRGKESGAVKRFSGTSQFIDETNTEWEGSSDTTIEFTSEECVATLYIPASGATKTLNFEAVFYSGPFSITQSLAISSNPVSFISSAYFTAELTHKKSWTITITGATSGAIKRITGNSKIISLTNATWDGSSDTTFFFRLESCQAVLSFAGSVLTESINFTISSPKTHPGHLINDFESASFGTYLGSYNGNFFDTPDQATSTIDLLTYSPAPQGNKVLRFDCNDVNSSYYTGGVYHNSVGTNYGIAAADSNTFYLNLFVYGYSGGNAALSVEILESDGDKWQPAQILVNWTGWKLLSFPLGSMSKTGTGNSVRESNRINGVNISMNSVPQGQNCRALVDYIIFTTGDVLKP